MDKFPITQEGYNNLEKEIERLKRVERPKIIKAIATAREFGDLSENAEYNAAKEAQSLNEGRIADLENKYAKAEVIDVSKLSNDNVKFGAKVQLRDEENGTESVYHIVGEYEADITHRMISIKSPLAKALIGKARGEIVEVLIPNGTKVYEILDISFA